MHISFHSNHVRLDVKKTISTHKPLALAGLAARRRRK